MTGLSYPLMRDLLILQKQLENLNIHFMTYLNMLSFTIGNQMNLLLILVAFDRIPGIAVLPAVVILCRELLVSGLREFLAETRVSVPVSRLAQWKTALQLLTLGFLLVGPAGPDFGRLSTTDVGVIGLWIAAILTLITGYDYLRAGIRQVDRLDHSDRSVDIGETRK